MVLQLQNQVTECAMLTWAARNYIEEKGFGEYHTQNRTFYRTEDHESGDVSSVNTDIIKVGQCFSVEPGIYLPDEKHRCLYRRPCTYYRRWMRSPE